MPKKKEEFTLSDIFKQIKPIGKTHTNQVQRYKYRSIDDIYNMLQPVLAQHGIFCETDVQNSNIEVLEGREKKRTFMATVRVRYSLRTPDGQVLASGFAEGFALDNSDKALNKALANAHKYWLIQTFLLPTGEPDPDNDSPEVSAEHPQQPRQSQRQDFDATVVAKEFEFGDKKIPKGTPLSELDDNEIVAYATMLSSIEPKDFAAKRKLEKCIMACIAEGSRRSKKVHQSIKVVLGGDRK